MWGRGFINGMEYQVKSFSEGSQYGINGGKISKLAIRLGNRWVLTYDRGWDIAPNTNDKAIMAVYNEIIRRYN